MRYVGSYKNSRLRDAQIDYFISILSKCKSKYDFTLLTKNIFSPSELAYIAQRLHIIKLILEDKSYFEIKNYTGTTSSTINASKLLLRSFDNKMVSLINTNKFIYEKAKPSKTMKEKPFVSAHYPGAIKLK